MFESRALIRIENVLGCPGNNATRPDVGLIQQLLLQLQVARRGKDTRSVMDTPLAGRIVSY